MSDEVVKSIRVAVVTGIFSLVAAFGAAMFKGYSEIQLERAKQDSRLILKALDAGSIEERRRSLEFLVDTDLIHDGDTKVGLRKYFEGESPKTPPRIESFIQSGDKKVLVPQSHANKGKTDLSLFVCEKDITRTDVKEMVEQVKEVLIRSNRFGASDLKVWGGELYREIPLSELLGRTTVILDEGHPEFDEWSSIEKELSAIASIPTLKRVANRGEVTPWRVSVVICTVN